MYHKFFPKPVIMINKKHNISLSDVLDHTTAGPVSPNSCFLFHCR
jgi:hypothetical protein